MREAAVNHCIAGANSSMDTYCIPDTSESYTLHASFQQGLLVTTWAIGTRCKKPEGPFVAQQSSSKLSLHTCIKSIYQLANRTHALAIFFVKFSVCIYHSQSSRRSREYIACWQRMKCIEWKEIRQLLFRPKPTRVDMQAAKGGAAAVVKEP